MSATLGGTRRGALPVRWLLTPDLLPDRVTLASIERLAAEPGLAHHVAVLPDVHAKTGRATPTGTVIATREALLPAAVDTGIACGIRMVRCGLEAARLSAEELDRLFAGLMRRVPVSRHEQDALSPAELEAVLAEGAAWCVRRFGLPADELDAIEDGGRGATHDADREALLASLPPEARRKAPRCFGTIGAGNHFLELQEIVEILDPERARRLGLARGQAFFMIHTGSRAVGNKTMKAILATLAAGGDAGGAPVSAARLAPIAADSDAGRRATLAIQAAASFGFANRAALHHALRESAREALGEPALELPLVYDCAHVSIKRETWKGEALWVHRHGASRALPASRLPAHPVFAHTGQPVPVPGSMGDDSYVCVAGEGAALAFHSVNHGCGRKLDKPEAAARFTTAEVEAELGARRVRLYRYGRGDLAEQAPAAFKSASGVIAAMRASELARPVARLRPVAVLKG